MSQKNSKFFPEILKSGYPLNFSDFFIEQTVTTIARKLNFSGFPQKISGFFGTSVLQRVIFFSTSEGTSLI